MVPAENNDNQLRAVPPVRSTRRGAETGMAGKQIMRRRHRLLLQALAMLALLPVPLLASSSFNAWGCDCTTDTFTTSTTTSGTTTVTTPGNSALASGLRQALTGPNGASVAAALGQALGPGAVNQTLNVFITSTLFFSPTTIPIGGGPGTFGTLDNNPNCVGGTCRLGPVNCNAPPPNTNVWPAANCSFTGYQQFIVLPGLSNTNTNTDFDITTQVTLSGAAAGLIGGDLYTAFQTAILDGDFRFVDTLLGRGRDAGPASPFSAMPMGFAPDRHIETPQIDATLAYAKAPMAVKAPRSAPLGGGWSAWIRGDGGRARVGGDANNFGFGYRTAAGETGMEYATGPWLIGGAFGIGRADVNQDVTGDSGALGTVQLGGYGAYRPGPYVLSGALTYGHHAIDATRLSMLPMPSTASYGADSFGAGLELSTKRVLQVATIEPMAGLAYNALWTNGFTETGDPLFDLTGNKASVATLKGYVGARAFTSYAVGATQVTPELRARLLYDFLHDPRSLDASFVADPTATFFPVAGISPNRTSEMLGASLRARLAPLWLAFLSYDAEIRGSDVGHFVSGGIKVSW